MSTPVHPLAPNPAKTTLRKDGSVEELSHDALSASLSSLRRLLELIDAGDLECEPEQRERLRGAEAALLALIASLGM